MPSNIPATTIRIDPEAKKEATAILRAPVRKGGLPFEMRVKAPVPDGKTAR